MLDELGTGMYLTGTDGIATDTYAYDEFGRSLDPYTGKEKSKYQKQGNIIQSLAFTGYQADDMTDSYFAQARYYDARNGRFVSEDKVRGHKIRPDSINHYLYCYNRPVKLIDLDGREPIDDEFVDFSTFYDGYEDAKARYDEECEKNSSGKTLEELQAEYYEGIPDYTEVIDSWVSEQEKFFDEIYEDIDTAGPGGLYAIAELYYQFYEHVKTGGSMDIKQEESWKEAFAEYGIPYPGDGGLFVYHGQVMDPATLGNVIYAYVGSKYFTEFELYSGGAAVQVKRYHWQDLIYMYFLPYWGDMDEDHDAIALGIKWRKEGFSCDE